MKVSIYYDLDGQPIEDWADWARLFKNADRIVQQDTLPNGKYVSTVWLGLDHNFTALITGREHEPLIWESMVFEHAPSDGPLGDELDMRRYGTREQALAGHKELVEKWKT